MKQQRQEWPGLQMLSHATTCKIPVRLNKITVRLKLNYFESVLCCTALGIALQYCYQAFFSTESMLGLLQLMLAVTAFCSLLVEIFYIKGFYSWIMLCQCICIFLKVSFFSVLLYSEVFYKCNVLQLLSPSATCKMK